MAMRTALSGPSPYLPDAAVAARFAVTQKTRDFLFATRREELAH